MNPLAQQNLFVTIDRQNHKACHQNSELSLPLTLQMRPPSSSGIGSREQRFSRMKKLTTLPRRVEQNIPCISMK